MDGDDTCVLRCPKGVLDPVNTSVVLWGGARPPVADLAPGAAWLVVAGGLTTGLSARRTR